jgi:hypothetical protein
VFRRSLHECLSSKHDKIELVRDCILALIQLSDGSRDIFYSPDRYSKLLRNLGEFLSDYTVSHPIRLLLTSAAEDTEIKIMVIQLSHETSLSQSLSVS